MRKMILLAGAAAMAAAMPALSQGRGQGQGKGGPPQAERRVEREHRRAERSVERDVRRDERREVRGERDWNGWMDRRPRGGDESFGDRLAYWREGRPMPVRVARDGCPPGLAKQNAFCLPPGQLRRAQLIGQRVDASRLAPVPEEWLHRFADGDDFYYRYDTDGFVYRIDRGDDLVSTVFPLFASGLMVGEPLPLGYDVYNLPMPYRERYIDGDDHLYRYDDGAIYQIDPQTRLIESVVALLAGQPLTIGSALPSGYDAYNLPLGYRDRFVDDGDSLYRYANGGIYEVDPTTMLVQALVEMVI